MLVLKLKMVHYMMVITMKKTNNILILSIDDYDMLFDNADKLGEHDNDRLITAISNDIIKENRPIIEAKENIKEHEALMLYSLREGMYIIWLDD